MAYQLHFPFKRLGWGISRTTLGGGLPWPPRVSTKIFTISAIALLSACLWCTKRCVAPFPETSTVLRACQGRLLIIVLVKIIWHAPPLSLLCGLQGFAWVVIQPHHHILDDLSILFGI